MTHRHSKKKTARETTPDMIMSALTAHWQKKMIRQVVHTVADAPHLKAK